MIPLLGNWTNYAPADFLLFSSEVYVRQFVLYNEAVWPMQFAALVAGAIVLYTVAQPAPTSGKWRLAYVIAAVAWAIVGWFYMWLRYGEINWAAYYVAPAFGVEAALLLWLALRPPPAGYSSRLIRHSATGLGIVALLIYPMMAGLAGRPWQGGEIFALMPDPTAILTLALLIPARGWLAAAARIIPLLWCLASAATLWVLGPAAFWAEPWLMPALAIAAVILGAYAGPFAGQGDRNDRRS